MVTLFSPALTCRRRPFHVAGQVIMSAVHCDTRSLLEFRSCIPAPHHRVGFISQSLAAAST